jgi:hypothetical protein
MSDVLSRHRRPGPLVIAGGLVVAVIGAVALNYAVATIAHAGGASHDYVPLQVGTYSFFTIVGILAGAVGWAIVRARAANPQATLRVLVPAVLVVSLVPDVLVGVAGQMSGTSWGAVAALMVMHVVVAAVAVPVYARILPLQSSR